MSKSGWLQPPAIMLRGVYGLFLCLSLSMASKQASKVVLEVVTSH